MAVWVQNRSKLEGDGFVSGDPPHPTPCPQFKGTPTRASNLQTMGCFVATGLRRKLEASLNDPDARLIFRLVSKTCHAAHFAHASFLSDQSTNPCVPTTTCCRRCRQKIVQVTRFLGHNRQEPKAITRIPTHPRLHSSFKGPPPNHPPGR